MGLSVGGWVEDAGAAKQNAFWTESGGLLPNIPKKALQQLLLGLGCLGRGQGLKGWIRCSCWRA